jgi:hypothetical protein
VKAWGFCFGFEEKPDFDKNRSQFLFHLVVRSVCKRGCRKLFFEEPIK